MGSIGRFVSILFWMGISVGVGLAIFVLLIRLSKHVPVLSTVGGVAQAVTGVNA